MLLATLSSVRIGKNCDLGLENAALGLRPRAAFSRPRSQFFPIQTSQPANNIYILASFFICEFMYLDFVSVHKHAKKELGQYPVILTSHLVNNPYIYMHRENWILGHKGGNEKVSTWNTSVYLNDRARILHVTDSK